MSGPRRRPVRLHPARAGRHPSGCLGTLLAILLVLTPIGATGIGAAELTATEPMTPGSAATDVETAGTASAITESSLASKEATRPSLATEEPSRAGLSASDGRPTTSSLGTRAAATTGTIDVTTTLFRTPDEPGSIRARTAIAVPDNVVEVTAALPDDAQVVGTEGMTTTQDGVEWDGETTPTAVTYVLPANRTGSGVGPEGAGGDLLLADVGDWAIVERPSIGLRYRYRGSVRVTRSAAVEGEGAVGTGLAYLGSHRARSYSANGQTFRLVVPRAADLVPSETAVFASMAHASDALRVGDRDETVLLVAAPTSVDWGVEGLQLGDADFYVTADEPLDEPGNTWLHEYVHTRDNLSLARDVRWFHEATATYYAALLTLEQERIGFEAFQDALDRGTSPRYDDVVLADPASWTDGAEYLKGALVAGDLDRRLRLATDSRTTLQAAFSRLNGNPDADAADFLGFLEATGGEDLRTAGSRFTETTATPSPWTLGEHERAFGQLPARVEVALPALPNGSAWRVGGPYRNASFDPTAERIVPGETVTVDVPVTNAGGTAGAYEFDVRLDGESVATRTGTIPANSTRWVPVSVSPTSVGTHTLAVAGERVEITVADPARLETHGLRVEPDRVPPGSPVGVSVTAANPADLPGQRTVEVRLDGETVEDRIVRLGPREEQTVEFVLRIEAPGEHRVAVGGETATVQVGDANSGDGGGDEGGDATTGEGGSGGSDGSATDGGGEDTPGEGGSGDQTTGEPSRTTTDGGGSGFGAPAAAVALVWLVVLGVAAVRRQPRR